MEEIKLAISVPNTLVYDKIVLRRFFCMTFIDENGLYLHTYIASVFGGVTDDLVTTPEKALKSIQNKHGVDCKLGFELLTNYGVSIRSITDLTKSLTRQEDKLEKVWGDCFPLTCQEDVNRALREFYPDLYKTFPHIAVNLSDNRFIKINNWNPDRRCIVTEGDFYYKPNYDHGASFYELSYPGRSLGAYVDGLEVVNWIKIDIELQKSIFEHPVLFSVLLEKNKIITPDFSLYFALPWGIVTKRDSYVKIGEDRVYNAIQNVADDILASFNEWITPPESISEKRVMKVHFRSEEVAKFVNINELSQKGPLSVGLHFDNLKNSNSQFFSGLLIAFFLAFCADKTRINDLYRELEMGCPHLEDGMCRCRTVCACITLIAPVLLLISFISIILTPKRALLNIRKARFYEFFLRVLRVIGLVTTVLLMIYVFVLWLIIPDIMRLKVSCQLNYLILRDGAIISFSTNIIYIFYCLVILKRKLYKFI